MKEQFATYEVSKQLKELGFEEQCTNFFEENGELKFNNGEEYKNGNTEKGNWLASNHRGIEYYSAPLWQQVEKWLWEKHRIQIVTKLFNATKVDSFRAIFLSYKDKISKDDIKELGITINFDSPITAKIEGITKAVEYLHKQLNK